MRTLFLCPKCELPGQFARDQIAAADWRCPRCATTLPGYVPATPDGGPRCVVCGNSELYKKKNFPHWLGLSVLTIACVAFFVGHLLYHPWIAWTVLIVSAVIDGGLYLWVGDVAVCYRCGAHFVGMPGEEKLEPFDLGTSERYRQERIRLERMREEKAE